MFERGAWDFVAVSWAHYWTHLPSPRTIPFYRTHSVVFFFCVSEHLPIYFRIYKFLPFFVYFLSCQGTPGDPESKDIHLLLFAKVSKCLEQCLAQSKLSVNIEWSLFHVKLFLCLEFECYICLCFCFQPFSDSMF